MTTEKTLLIIGSAPFIIDSKQREFRRFNRPENKIPFEDLKNEGAFYSHRYTGKAIGVYEKIDLDNLLDVNIDLIIPALILESNGLMTTALQNDLNLMSQKEGWGFFLGDDNLAMRLSGKLPHIDLAGTDFTIDWRLKELRETELPWKHISLRDMEMSDNGEEYLCFYNTETHELFEPDEKLLELPENVVVLEIPNEVKLDPVAVAREHGMEATGLLNEHPLQMQLAAKVTPLADTGLPEYIENNKKLAVGNAGNVQDTSRKRGR